MSDARPLLVIGCAMLVFGSINACLGLSLMGERGEANKVVQAFAAHSALARMPHRGMSVRAANTIHWLPSK